MTKLVFIHFVLGLLTLVFADTSIDAQISAIQNANPSQRVKLMNQFKRQLSTMNHEERNSAISAMRAKMHANKQNKMHSGMQRHAPKQQGHKQEMQMQHGEHMNQMQNMQQHQAGSQYQQEQKQMQQETNGGNFYKRMQP